MKRKLFSSKKAVAPFLGSATSQIKQAANVTGNLGAKRKALIEKHGFDTKFAYHAIRVARMMSEFLACDGKWLNIHREDAQDLLNIRNGLWTEDEKKCSLPDEPDYQEINRLCCVSMVKYLVV